MRARWVFGIVALALLLVLMGSVYLSRSAANASPPQMAAKAAGQSVPLIAPAATPPPMTCWQTLVNTDFDRPFPGPWIVTDENGTNYGEFYWGARTCRPFDGGKSGWAVGGGADGDLRACGATYMSMMDSWMAYGPFSLVGASGADLRFKRWVNSQSPNDKLCWKASVGGSWYGTCTSGTSKTWTDTTFNLASVPTLGNLVGKPQVLVALIFNSDGPPELAEGAYVDNVVLRKCVCKPCPSTNVVNAPRAAERPVIDGDLYEWGQLDALRVDWLTASFIEMQSPSPQDLSAAVQLAWAADTIYVSAVITDDVLIGNDSTKIWEDDILELAFHTPTDYQISLALDGRQAVHTADDVLSTGVTFITKTVPGGWQLEAAIPSDLLGLTALSANQRIPFTWALWDDDLGHGNYGQTHLFWQSNTTNEYKSDWVGLLMNSFVYNFPQPPTPTPTPTATSTATDTPTATPTATETPTPTPTPEMGEVSGVVWYDDNGNGILEPGESGLPGVQIRLLEASQQVATATTDEDGKYSFLSLPPGTYTVVESQPSSARYSSTPDQVPVEVVAGGRAVADFGDWGGLPTWLPLLLAEA